MPLLDQKLDLFTSKSNECKNKTYSRADMTAAGCRDSDTVDACGTKLFDKCIYTELNNLENQLDAMALAMNGMDQANAQAKMALRHLSKKPVAPPQPPQPSTPGHR